MKSSLPIEDYIIGDVMTLSRIERGCYIDILLMQKRKGKLTLSNIESLLGSDFTICWPVIKLVLTKSDDGYYISWLEDAIQKRVNYSKSRSANRLKSKSANIVPDVPGAVVKTNTQAPMVQQMADTWHRFFPGYPGSTDDDYPALLDFARFIGLQLAIKVNPEDQECIKSILEKWEEMCPVIDDHPSWRKKSIGTLAKFNKQEIYTRIGEVQREQQKRMIL